MPRRAVFHDTGVYDDGAGTLTIAEFGTPDPASEADGQWLMTATGASVWVPAAASLVPVADAGGYFTGSDVEAALQELGASAGGAEWKQQSRLATTAALPANTYSNGASGVGATLTGVAFGALSIDGVTPSVGDRVLVKNEATQANNGIYTVTTVGAIATLYVLTRASDYNQAAEVVAGTATFVTEGTANADTAWVQTTTGTITMGSSSLVFAQFGAGGGGSPTGSAGGVLDGTYPNPGLAAAVAGAGLAETSDVLSVNVDGSTIEINSDALRVKAGGIGANELAATAVTPATYGDSSNVGQFTVDADGRITAASSVAIGVSPPAGSVALVYRYTVTGTDKASIDTGVDTPDAGSNDWTNGDFLEVYCSLRTDETPGSFESACSFVWNNDTGSVYDLVWVGTVNATAIHGNSRGAAKWQIGVASATADANNFVPVEIRVPNYTSAVSNKAANLISGNPNGSAAANMKMLNFAGEYRPVTPAALTRLSIAPTTALKKLKVGSQLLIYKRLAS